MSWFVRNVRDMKWWDRGPRGFVTELVGDDEAQVGVNLFVLEPGPADVDVPLGGRPGGLPRPLRARRCSIVEDEEQPLRAVGLLPLSARRPAHDRRRRLGAVRRSSPSARESDQEGADWGGYPYSELAMKHDASAEEETTEPEVAYARFPARQPGEFREDWLPLAREPRVDGLGPEAGAVLGRQLLELEPEDLLERRDRVRPDLVDASPAGRARARSS